MFTHLMKQKLNYDTSFLSYDTSFETKTLFETHFFETKLFFLHILKQKESKCVHICLNQNSVFTHLLKQKLPSTNLLKPKAQFNTSFKI